MELTNSLAYKFYGLSILPTKKAFILGKYTSLFICL